MKKAVQQTLLEFVSFDQIKIKQRAIIYIFQLFIFVYLLEANLIESKNSNLEATFIYDLVDVFMEYLILDQVIKSFDNQEFINTILQAFFLAISLSIIIGFILVMLLKYLMMKNSISNIDFRNPSFTQILVTNILFGISLISDIYAWIIMHMIITNSFWILLIDSSTNQKLLAVLNILLSIMISVFFLLYSMKVKTKQKNILVLRKRFQTILIFVIIISIYIIEGCSQPSKKNPDGEIFHIYQLMQNILILLFDLNILWIFLFSINTLFEKIDTFSLFVLCSLIRFPLSLISLITKIINTDHQLDTLFIILLLNLVPLLIIFSQRFWDYRFTLILDQAEAVFEKFTLDKVEKSTFKHRSEIFTDIYSYMKYRAKFYAFENIENRLHATKVITNHLYQCKNTGCMCNKSNFVEEQAKRLRSSTGLKSIDTYAQDEFELSANDLQSQMTSQSIKNFYFDLLLLYLEKAIELLGILTVNQQNQNSELIMILTLFELSKYPRRLFLSSIRMTILNQKYFNSENYSLFSKPKISCSYNFIQKQGLNQQLLQSIKKYINFHIPGDFDIKKLYYYDQLLVLSGQQVLKAINIKNKIFNLLQDNYQNALPYLLDQYTLEYLEQRDYIKNNFDQMVSINLLANQNYKFALVYYTEIDYNMEYIKRLKQQQLIKLKSSEKDYKILAQLNKSINFSVISVFHRGELRISNYSSQFNNIINSQKQKESFQGENVEILMPKEFKVNHKTYVNRFIQTGKTKLLSSSAFQTFIEDTSGYIFHCQATLRIDTSSLHEFRIFSLFQKSAEKETLIIADYEGFIINYSEQAGSQLRLNDIANQLLRTNQKNKNKGNVQIVKDALSNINIKLLSPVFININEEEFEEPLILLLIPRIITKMQNRLLQDQEILQNEPRYLVQSLKHFLVNPDDCFLFITAMKYNYFSYSDSSIVYRAIQLYQYREILDIDMKVFALEIMLKQVIKKLEIKSELYLMTYTTYQTQAFTKTNKSSDIKTDQLNQISKIEDDDWNDNQVESDLDSKFIEQLMPQDNVVKHFPFYYDNKYENIDSNIASLMSPSSNNVSQVSQFHLIQQNQMVSPRQLQEVEEEITIRENPNIIDKEEKFEDQFNNERENYVARKTHEKSINLDEINEQELVGAIQQIRQDLKKYKSMDVKKDNAQNFFSNKKKKYTQIQSHSSTTEKEDNYSLINHLISTLINNNPKQLYFLVIFFTLQFIIINGLILVNLFSVEENFEHLTEDFINRVFPIQLQYDINLAYIGIQFLDFYKTEKESDEEIYQLVNNYISQGYSQYRENVIKIYHEEQERHDFIIMLENKNIDIEIKKGNLNLNQSIVFRQSYFYHTFLQEVLNVLADKNFRSYSLDSINEQVIDQNYQKIIQQLLELEGLTKWEVQDRLNIVNDLIIIILCAELIFSLFLIIAIKYQIYQCLSQRNALIQTYFLFQSSDLQYYQKQIIPDKIDLLGSVKELNTKKEEINSAKKLNRNKEVIRDQRKSDEIKNTKLKQRFLVQIWCQLFFLMAISVLYFVPFNVYIKMSFDERIELNGLTTKIGFTQLSFQSELTLFVSRLSSIVYNDNEKYQRLQEYYEGILSEFKIDERFITNEFPFSSRYNDNENEHLQQIIRFQVDNICELIEEQEFLDFIEELYYHENEDLTYYFNNCSQLLNGCLLKGYTYFLSEAYGLLVNWNSELNLDGQMKINDIINDADGFHQILKAYSIIIQYSTYLNRNIKLYLLDTTESALVIFDIITATSLVFIVVIQISMYISIYDKIQSKVRKCKQLMKIFNPQLIQRNKHLYSILTANSKIHYG